MKSKRFALLISAFVLGLMCFGIVGCGAQAATPTDTVTAALDALKAQDADKLSQYYSGDLSGMKDPESALQSVEEATGNEALGDASSLTPEQLASAQKLVDVVLDFDYALSNEKIDGDKATVDVQITTYDFGTAAGKFIQDYMTQAFSMAFSGNGDQDAIQDKAFELLDEATASLTSKDKTTTATVTLTKGEDGTWKVDDLKENEGFADAILGGAISSLKDMAESLASSFNFDGLSEE